MAWRGFKTIYFQCSQRRVLQSYTGVVNICPNAGITRPIDPTDRDSLLDFKSLSPLILTTLVQVVYWRNDLTIFSDFSHHWKQNNYVKELCCIRACFGATSIDWLTIHSYPFCYTTTTTTTTKIIGFCLVARMRRRMHDPKWWRAGNLNPKLADICIYPIFQCTWMYFKCISTKIFS